MVCRTLRAVLGIWIGIAVLGGRAAVAVPPFAYEEIIEQQFGKLRVCQRIWRMGTFLRLDPMQSPTKPASSQYARTYWHLVPNGIGWTYAKTGLLMGVQAIVLPDLKWWAFWQEVKRKGLEQVIKENRINAEGQKLFAPGAFYSESAVEQRIEAMRRMYDNFPFVPWKVSQTDLKLLGKRIGEEAVHGAGCWVYEKEDTAQGTVIRTRYWIGKQDGMVWQRERMYWKVDTPQKQTILERDEVIEVKVMKSLPAAIFELPPGTVAELPEKVQEYVTDCFGLGHGVHVVKQKGFGIIFNPVTAADFEQKKR